jgi:hypothetical protein
VPFFAVGDNGPKGEQVRGFGFLHDGSCDTLFRFHGAVAFSFGPTEAAQLEQFMLVMDTNLKPIVGQQVTRTSANASATDPRITLLIAQATANNCQLTVKGVLNGEQRGWLRLPDGSFQSDRNSQTHTDAELRGHVTTAGQERTYLCVPPGSGTRVGIDRDEDGFLDHDEIDAGSDPADPSSTPSGGTTSTTSSTTTSSTSTTSPPAQEFIPIPTGKLTMKDQTIPSDPSRRKVIFKSSTKGPGFVYHIVPPAQGGPNDPRSVGGVIAVYNSVSFGGELVIAGLPKTGWTASGTNTYKFKGTSTAAITRVVLKNDLITFKGGKAAWNYSLNEPSQGRVAAALIIGNSFWCSDAPAKLPPSANDHVDKFVAEPNSPAPPFCISP